MRKVVTQFNYIVDPGETNSHEYLVDTSGYIDSETQIKRFLIAGENLIASRAQYFDSDIDGSDLSDDNVDTFDPIDFVDAYKEIERQTKKQTKKNNISSSSDEQANKKPAKNETENIVNSD